MKSSNQNDKMQLVKEVPSGLFAKLLSKLQNQILQHDFAILPLRQVMRKEFEKELGILYAARSFSTMLL